MRAALLGLICTGLAYGCAESSPRAQFDDAVLPILESRCSSTVCHGVLRGSQDVDVVDWERLFFLVDADGRLADREAAYASARRVINTDERPELSSLLRKPLPTVHGGWTHAGHDNFTSPLDPGFVAVRDWIARETDGGENVAPLDDGERLFADTVQPALVSASCLNASCHGLDSAVPYRLDPGMDGRFSRAATRANYEASLLMLSLDGVPSQSRLLRKSLPLWAGGIVHRGGNAGFFSSEQDPRSEAIRKWACAERVSRLGQPCTEEGAPSFAGLVFIRGPVAAASTFDVDVFVPGTDLFFAAVNGADLTLGEPANLTVALHDGPADVRDPAVHHAGRKVAFAMRTSAETGHDIYEIDLDTREARRFTDDAGPLPGGGTRTYRDPTYGPDGHLWFVSTRAGVLADGGERLDADLYELDPDDGSIVRQTFTPHIERKPVFLVHGEEAGGEVAFTALRETIPSQARAHPFRFPPDLSTEYHQHFGVTPPEDLFHDLRELPDGRYVMVIGDLDNVWEGGRLGILDRNFGPEIPPTATSSTPSLPGYAPPLTRLDPDAQPRAITRGFYRDPVALPDGRLLVAYSPQEMDLSDPSTQLDLRIDVLTIEEAVDGAGPRIASRRTLIDEPGVSDRDPEPIFRRRPAHLGIDPDRDRSAETGLFIHNGLPIIDAILDNLPPSGTKQMRPDFAYVRLIEALSIEPSDGPETFGLSDVSPARILAEIPLAPDGTFAVEVPAGVPFRLQGLDVERRAVGVMHNRWFYVSPGQKIVQGSPAAAYDQRCAMCHGSRDGKVEGALVVPDILTGASITASRYEAKNPRRPRPIGRVGRAGKAGDHPRIELDFMADVQPLLDRACATSGCHDGEASAAGLTLTSEPSGLFTAAYKNLLSGGYATFENDGRATSPLMQKMSTHPQPILTVDERLTLGRWIDLGASFRGRQ